MTMEPTVEQPKGMESVVRKDILAKSTKGNFPYLNGPTDKIMEFRRMWAFIKDKCSLHCIQYISQIVNVYTGIKIRDF